MKSAVGLPAVWHGPVVGDPPPPRTRSQWYIVWFAISNSSGCARMMAITCRPCGVSLMTPVAKMVAHTSLATRKFMMSTAGSIRPPMSKVSATSSPAFGMRAYVAIAPPARLPALQAAVTGGRAVDAGVEDGPALGMGVTPGTPATISSQPTSRSPGSAASAGYRSAFHAWSCSTVAPKRRAMLKSVSPPRTTYVVTSALPDVDGDGDGVSEALGSCDGTGEADPLPLGEGLVVAVLHATSTATSRTGAAKNGPRRRTGRLSSGCSRGRRG